MHGEKKTPKQLQFMSMIINEKHAFMEGRKVCFIKNIGVKQAMQIRIIGKFTDVLIHHFNTDPNVLW